MFILDIMQAIFIVCFAVILIMIIPVLVTLIGFGFIIYGIALVIQEHKNKPKKRSKG